MKLTLSLSLLGVLIFATAAEAQTTVLRNARVIDGTGARHLIMLQLSYATVASFLSVHPPIRRFPMAPRSSTIAARPSSLVSSPRTRMSEFLLGSRLPRRTTIASPFCGS